MRIRSITYFIHPRYPFSELLLRKAGIFAQHAKQSLEAAGYEVQTARLATPPFSEYLPDDQLAQAAVHMEVLAHSEGFDYVSLGPATPDKLSSYQTIPQLLANSGNLFFSGMVTTPDQQISLPAIKASAQVIHQAAPLEENGFANLRFAALANVPPWGPFFPAAYHQGKAPAFALAIEAADLAVETFSQAKSLSQAQDLLIESIERHAQKLETVCDMLEKTYQVSFKGLDFSTAPFPTPSISIGNALEQLGLPAVGLAGSLTAATILMDALDRARFKRTGFNGLMFPMLEDATFSKRGAEGTLSIADFLLYSAVCGTGLDTIPLPGDASKGSIQAVLLDVAALSLRLNKPLTARLMPIPGKKPGDETGFDFEFFANSKVLALDAQPLRHLLDGDENLKILPRTYP
jgi:uncharacterized protein (UPF0210 family)